MHVFSGGVTDFAIPVCLVIFGLSIAVFSTDLGHMDTVAVTFTCHHAHPLPWEMSSKQTEEVPLMGFMHPS